jgi:hypothetical protein
MELLPNISQREEYKKEEGTKKSLAYKYTLAPIV